MADSPQNLHDDTEWGDYILGFFEGLTARHSYAHLSILDGLE